MFVKYPSWRVSSKTVGYVVSELKQLRKKIGCVSSYWIHAFSLKVTAPILPAAAGVLNVNPKKKEKR